MPVSKNYFFTEGWIGGRGPWVFLSGDPITWNKGGAGHAASGCGGIFQSKTKIKKDKRQKDKKIKRQRGAGHAASGCAGIFQSKKKIKKR